MKITTKAVAVLVSMGVLTLLALTSCEQENDCMVRAKYELKVDESLPVLMGKKTWHPALTVDSDLTISDESLFDNKGKYNVEAIALNNANVTIVGKLGVKPQGISGTGIVYCDNAGTLNKNLSEHVAEGSSVQILNSSVLSTGSYTTNSLEYAPCDAEVGDVIEYNGKEYIITEIN